MVPGSSGSEGSLKPLLEWSGQDRSGITDAILARRSMRGGFDASPVVDATLGEVVRCGLAAPSSKNAQPWRIHIVTDRALLAEFADEVEHADDAGEYVPHDATSGRPRPEYASTVLESAQVLREVAAAIFIENRGLFSGGRATLARADRRSIEDSLVGFGLEMIGIGAAMENMWLAAESFGLQVVFMGDVVIAEAAIAGRLRLEGDLVGVLAVGYSAEPTVVPPRPLKHGMEECVCWHRPEK